MHSWIDVRWRQYVVSNKPKSVANKPENTAVSKNPSTHSVCNLYIPKHKIRETLHISSQRIISQSFGGYSSQWQAPFIGTCLLGRKGLLAGNLKSVFVSSPKLWELLPSVSTAIRLLNRAKNNSLQKRWVLPSSLSNFQPTAPKRSKVIEKRFTEKCSPQIAKEVQDESGVWLSCQHISTTYCLTLLVPKEKARCSEVVAMDIMRMDVSKKRETPVLHVADTVRHMKS